MPDPRRVVPDTSCLIALSALSLLDLLHDLCRLPSLSAALDALDAIGFHLSFELKGRAHEIAGE